MTTLKLAITAGAFTLLAGAASAATVFDNAGTCNVADLTPEADACFGLVTDVNDSTNFSTGNNKLSLNADIFNGDVAPGYNVDGDVGLWGITTWEFLGKTADGVTTGPNGDQVSYDEGGSFDNFGYGGDLSIFDAVAFVFKQGNALSIYGYGGDLPSMGTYSLASLFGQDSGNNLSHLSVYGYQCVVGDDGGDDCDDDETVVPLPAAGWLLLGGLGGLAAMRRRNKV